MLTTCLLAWSMTYGIDPELVKAVIKTESNYDANAIGSVGEVGLLQVRPEYVPETAEQLKDPCINIKRGIQILANAKKYCKHKIDKTWVNCYNLGVAGGNKIKHPKLFPYYKKIMANYKGSLNATEQR